MKQKRMYSAYRSPRFSWKDVGISLVTLGFRKPGDFQEEAKIYKLILENNTLDIYMEASIGETELLETVKIDGKAMKAIEEKNKYYSERFVYHLDRY